MRSTFCPTARLPINESIALIGHITRKSDNDNNAPDRTVNMKDTCPDDGSYLGACQNRYGPDDRTRTPNFLLSELARSLVINAANAIARPTSV